ncbi:right-handed parallel beta-helix repeat-containing protein [Roseibacillus ishigakijimensis]|uniref:Right-handed parallel beta-helix repeat-containing protein n=1 Tax=Roseibacillus ishigakijimensis TaxID=454146 RepID=A0A934RKV1_9BACT|nr:right-handed parallel beta-helix repeat-containing protein [Roseibacillus ishigakijimensis]MBK1832703.1 right-handed parallel beta-helix repeat-containing protein [Roseibacillus ishigakijimensis]
MTATSELSREEALTILGLTAKDDLTRSRAALEEVRAHLRRLRDEATTPDKRIQYEVELVRFEEALHVLYAPRKKRIWPVVVGLLLLLLLGGGGYSAYRMVVEQERLQAQVEALLGQAASAVADRNWEEAEGLFARVEGLDSENPAVPQGRRQIEEGREEERRMEINFAFGKVKEKIEIQAWGEAEEALAAARDLAPEDERGPQLESDLRAERRREEIRQLVEGIEQAHREENWQKVIHDSEELAVLAPEHERLADLQEKAREAELILRNLKNVAQALYGRARSLDDGEYSAEALELLREAQRLAPSEAAGELYEKMSGYVQTIEVPEEAETLADALAQVRPGDKVLLGEGVFQESVLVPAGIILEGQGEGKTVLEVPADAGSVLVIAGEGPAVRLSHLTLRHSGFTDASERYPVVLLQEAQAELENCVIEYGAGHGLAVTGGGRATLLACEVKACGWDGIAVTGKGSQVTLEEVRALANLQHGLDVWDGAHARVARSRFQDNGLTGIFLTATGESSQVESSTVERNREVGVMLSKGAVAVISGNLIADNTLGGVVARDGGSRLQVTGNTIEKNGEAGLVVGKEVLLEKEEGNVATNNQGRQKWLNADFSQMKTGRPVLKALPVE